MWHGQRFLSTTAASLIRGSALPIDSLGISIIADGLCDSISSLGPQPSSPRLAKAYRLCTTRR